MNGIATTLIATDEFAAILRHDFESCHATELPPARRLPPLDPATRERMIAEHIARHGVTRSVDFGSDQPAIDALRAIGVTVLSARCSNANRPWIINGKRSNGADLWRLANAARRSVGLPSIRRGK